MPFRNENSFTNPLQSSRKGISAINRQSLTIDELVGGKHEHSLCHVLVASGAGAGVLALVLLLGDVALLVLVALAGRHLAGEGSRGDAVDADLEAGVGNLGSEHAVQVDGRRLAGVVAEMVLRALDLAADAANVDDGARPTLVPLRALL